MAKNSVCPLALVAVLAMLVGNCQSAPGPCGENDCGSCDSTCEEVARGSPVKPCTLDCKQGCFCKPGYVRNSEKKCVPPFECPCEKNAYYTRGSCVDNCPLTCANYKNPPGACTKQCREGCNCNKGFVRKSEGGDCVRPEECP